MNARAWRLAALALGLLPACSREEGAPPVAPTAEAPPPAPGDAGADFLNGSLGGMFSDNSDPDFVPRIHPSHRLPVDPSPDGWEDQTPSLSPAAAALAASWGEPEFTREGCAATWTWEGATDAWTLRIVGWPTLSDLDDAVTVNPNARFTLVGRIDGEESRIDVACWEDTHLQELGGVLRGRLATSEQLKFELASLLPAIVAHLGLQADERIEQAVQERGARAGLAQIARLTSGFARFRGYETLLREADEPSRSQLAAVLRQAAVDLPDEALRELLIETGDFSLDDRVVAGAVLAAAASIEDDDMLAEVLVEMLDRSDEVTPANLARVLHVAAVGIESDEALAVLLETAIWHGPSTGAVLAGWDEALATIQSQQALAFVIDSVLSIGDTPVRECMLVTRVAARIEDETLRATALRSVHIDELDEADVADAFVEAIRGLRDPDVLEATLTDLLKRKQSPLPLSVRWLAIAQPLRADLRLAKVLAAVPQQHLADPAVRSLYLPLATSLPSPAERQAALERAGVTEPASPPASPR